MTPPFSARFHNAVVYARGFSIRFEYANRGWVPTGSWREHRWLPGAYVHPHFPQMLWWVRPTGCTALYRSKAWPDLAMVQAFASAALGGARPVAIAEFVMPTALRVLLKPISGAAPPELTGHHRCVPLLSDVAVISGHEVEYRASVTQDAAGPTYYAEAILGTRHETFDGKQRAEFFSVDARKVVTFDAPHDIAPFMLRVLYDLMSFANDRVDIGLEVDRVGRCQLPPIARGRVVPHVDDIMFDVRLPLAAGPVEFAAFYWGRGYTIAPGPGVMPIVPNVA